VCGETTSDLLKRFSVEADSIEPDTIIFAIGINDSKYPLGEATNKVSFEQFKSNLRTLIQQAKNHARHIVIVGATKADENATRPNGSRFINSEIQRYNGALKELAELERFPFIDVFDVLDIADFYDGVHPRAGGYEKLFTKIRMSIVEKKQ
jgi:lysophospholipase L1-like esterase